MHLILLIIGVETEKSEGEHDGLRNQTPRYPHRLSHPLPLPLTLIIQIHRPNPNSGSMAPPILLSPLHERQWIQPNHRSLVRLAKGSKPKHHTEPAG